MANFNEATKQRLVSDIENDLRISAQSLPLLPPAARRAVAAAQLLFTRLNREIAKTSADELIGKRISVSAPQKVALLIRAVLGGKV